MKPPVALKRHTAVFAVATAAVLGVALWLTGSGGDSSVPILTALAIAVLFGMPHGALDLPRARIELGLTRRGPLAVFFVVYLGLVAACIALWWWQPRFALAGFLMYSAWHFAGDWRFDDRLAAWAGGLTTIGAPTLCHSDRVTEILNQITAGADVSLIVAAAALAGVAGLALFAKRCLHHRDRASLELALLWLLALTLPPLAFFAVYYGALHALRQTHCVLAGLCHARTRALGEALLSSLAVIAAGALAAILLTACLGISPDDALLCAVFIGLAALTVPHMLLDALLQRAHRIRSRSGRNPTVAQYPHPRPPQ
ncbi:Brp/Blh family beta-carotene 15,15'-dioxygenase [Salinisphaera sp.]|uniref:Brp/Blh family beta-carotene 15,15'-dioxygenase n=1 Tax=Salinisphaera sp. TaxID=1914330 RepID=UPI000C4BE85D|nr:Brp/Blh family beta-carotene 15,15'-dioxygenase [Salinisphaera sp.]MBS62106.1 hypothetical protein [Salinisphaera sp.]